MTPLLTERDFDIAQLDIEMALDELEAQFWKDYYGARPRRNAPQSTPQVQPMSDVGETGETDGIVYG